LIEIGGGAHCRWFSPGRDLEPLPWRAADGADGFFDFALALWCDAAAGRAAISAGMASATGGADPPARDGPPST